MNRSLEHPDQFEQLLAGNHARLRRIARSYAPESEVNDLIQEIALQAWRSRRSFRGQSAVETWLYRVALNTAISFSRRRKPVRQLFDTDLPSSTGDPVEPMNLLEEFLRSLDAVNRSIMLLYLEGSNNAAIGEVVGLKSNAVAVRLTRLKQRFESDYLEGAQ